MHMINEISVICAQCRCYNIAEIVIFPSALFYEISIFTSLTWEDISDWNTSFCTIETREAKKKKKKHIRTWTTTTTTVAPMTFLLFRYTHQNFSDNILYCCICCTCFSFFLWFIDQPKANAYSFPFALLVHNDFDG